VILEVVKAAWLRTNGPDKTSYGGGTESVTTPLWKTQCVHECHLFQL
jgi:hypothetical protein